MLQRRLPDVSQPPSRQAGQHRIQRRTALLTLLGFLVVFIAASGLFRSAEIPPSGEASPPGSESAVVAAELKARPGSDVSPVILVSTRADGAALTADDQRAISALTAQVRPEGLSPVGPPRPTLSQDQLAATTLVPVRAGVDNSDTIAPIEALRAAVAEGLPAGLNVDVTGGPAFGADVADSFSGADVRLLLTTVGIVGVLLLLTYRSPVLWLVPLIIIGLADQLAGIVTKAVGEASGLSFDAGIISVLVFGAGTNYALLLISRYREELRRESDHRVALAHARRATTPAILASNLTVVLALLTLLLAVVPSTRGLGLAGGIGLLIAAAAALLPLPAALSLVGRGVFWPFIPRAGKDGQTSRSPWQRVGTAVTARPGLVSFGAVVVLLALASGLFGTKVGLTQAQQFRVESQSQRGLATVMAHFPAGTAAPISVLTDEASQASLTSALLALPDVADVQSSGPPFQGRSVLSVVGEPVPGSPQARALVEAVRSEARDLPAANTLVGGAPAAEVDARAAAERDLFVIAPLVLALTALVLIGLLRAVLVPLVLLLVNALSALAAIGAGAWVGRELFGFPALDVQVPLLAFLFLVALGVDYTIFLVHRANQEARQHGIRTGMARAVGATGAVITSAGVVLAGVFAALGVLPLVVLGQIGLIVGLGVIIDTFVVRTLLVPGIVTLLGSRRAGVASPA